MSIPPDPRSPNPDSRPQQETHMPSHRGPRIAEAIREVVSSAILFEVADPRVKGVTVLSAEVSPDLRNATVFVSLMGTENERENVDGAGSSTPRGSSRPRSRRGSRSRFRRPS